MKIRDAQSSDAAGIARVQVDTWRTTYVGVVPQAHLDNLSYERSQKRWEQITPEWDRPGSNVSRYVVEDDQGRIVGFAVAGPIRPIDDDEEAATRLDLSPYDGELYGIYILQQYQGKGIGRDLVHRAARRLAALGMRAMVVWVLSGNPYRRFYEALGGKDIGEKDIVIGGAPLKETVYGWDDINTLCSENGGPGDLP